ncbi:MAG: succinate dehydrogenase [Acidobacteria bacterium]|nr:MAG: succinate dehydrogenase [Acidobacteriota bacterium]
MNGAIAIYRSSVGKKVIMGATGVIGFGYVLGHMIGNLQAFPFFGGKEAFNAYAHFLHHSHGLIYVARVILITAVVLHIVAAYQLWRMSAQARPNTYERWDPVASNYASRTMRWTGPLLLLFIIYHLLHLTFGTVHPNFNREGDVYSNLVIGFQNPLVSGFYIVAMLALSLHLYHGIWSMFQSLGLNTPKYDPFFHHFAVVFTVLVTIGFISVPVGVLTGIISL